MSWTQRLVRPASGPTPIKTPVTTPLEAEARGEAAVEGRPLTPREKYGFALWGILAVVVFVFEMLGLADTNPWPTLSQTVAHLQDAHDWVRMPILAGLVVLAARIVFYPWPSRSAER